ncbi:MAG TPA: isocitrate/isopropylmalate family dehydrogenase, partial [Thermoanaerobaculia bacterium]|nr:isocitrate/isopropylmalate family dehydrogenase [Thermoanaerobaculia bacterium]
MTSARDAPPRPLGEAVLDGGSHPAASGPHRLLVVEGEGIGPEVLAASLEVLAAVEEDGGGAVGVQVLRDERVDAVAAACRDAFAAGGALLAGPRGGRFVYDLRRALGLYCKISPINPWPELWEVGCLRAAARRDVDLLVVRENLFGVYQGEAVEHRDQARGRWVEHRFAYPEGPVRRVLRLGARLAQGRRGRMAVVVKEGGLPALSRLWRDCATEIAADHGVGCTLLDVDYAAYCMVQHAAELDVLVAPNLFGDVLSDLGGLLLGSRGLTFGGSFGAVPGAVYQTNHGAAHDLAGRDRADPAAQILALAMLLRESFGMAREAAVLEQALRRVWAAGWRTEDLAEEGCRIVGTREMGRLTARAVAEVRERAGV